MPIERAPPWRETSSQKISDKLNALIHGDSLWYFVSSTLRTFFAVSLLCQCVLSTFTASPSKVVVLVFLCARKEVNGDDNGSWSSVAIRTTSGIPSTAGAHFRVKRFFSSSHSSFPPSIAFLWCKSFADDDTGRIAGCCLLCARMLALVPIRLPGHGQQRTSENNITWNIVMTCCDER